MDIPIDAKAQHSNDATDPPASSSANNTAEGILSAWTALEVLSPQSYQDEADLVAGQTDKVVLFDPVDLPWEVEPEPVSKKRVYYELVFGSVKLEPLVAELLKCYSDDRPEKVSMKGYCPIASVIVDHSGKPINDVSSIAVSSFSWAAPIALAGDLQTLAGWPSREKTLKEGLFKRLLKRDDDQNIIPLSKDRIDKVFELLLQSLSLDSQFVEAPYFALRHSLHEKSRKAPEPLLLNSFYLDDLATARGLARSKTLPHALKHYLGVKKPQRQADLLHSKETLRYVLQPAVTSLGRWPSHGRAPLALLQQAAVNATNARRMPTGILAVNGPPGTGKTTLLRDVVAARIIERAKVMRQFEQPQKTFSPTGPTLMRDSAVVQLHRIDKRLKGFEIIVASSNNKAVENLSAELPGLGAIAADAPDLRYFKSIADNILGGEAWGMIAAVLGNAKNRAHFSQAFWRDDEHGMSTYLKHASGIPQYVFDHQEDGSRLKRNRAIVDDENPPANLQAALVRWKVAQTAFDEALSIAAETQEKRQALHNAVIRSDNVSDDLERLTHEQARQEAALKALKVSAKHVEKYGHEPQSRNKPRLGDFRKLLEIVGLRARQATAAQSQPTATLEQLHGAIDKAQEALEQLHAHFSSLYAEASAIKAEIKTLKSGLSISIPDSDFFSQSHDQQQIANLWFDAQDNRDRDTVFEAAIALHRAFIDCAADPLRQNISIFMESFTTRSLGTAERDAIFADLWTSFFLIVPVVSSTFASVHRMFSRLEPEALGWLLVDEAGQATPQAAIGAMIRTKRAVVVGDPLQIEPVVTLPSRLTRSICEYFSVDPLRYNAPEASVQTVADAASIFSSKLPIGDGYRQVGAPLLVHRRCDSPMFDISNDIAYANLMVQAKKPTTLSMPLGHSRWIDVVGESGPDKWCADEGHVLITLLQQYRESGATADFHIITPFVVVQNELRKLLYKSGILKGWVNHPKQWLWSNVGTVHTVQGREAPIVFFVLGAQAPTQNGARIWAGRSPNLMNVAVTRAKTALYVIGNRRLWKTSGVFSVLDRYL